MAFDEDKYLDYGPTKREQWAEDHGYMHYTCPQHGGFYSDTGEGCPSCPEEPKEDPDRDDDPEPEDFSDLYDDDISEPIPPGSLLDEEDCDDGN
jgi:hypothetical protein